MKKWNFIVLIFFGLLLMACTDNQNEVVVYTSVDQVFSEPVLQEFEKETGIKIKAVYDTEETKSTGVLNRLIAEANHPQCDVFWSGDPVRTSILKKKGITAIYNSPEAQDIPSVFKDSENHWIGFSARARVLIYNKTLLKPEEIPQSIFDLTKPEYHGKVAVANPLFGTTTFHMAALFSVLGNEKATKLLQDLKNNNIVIATSNGDVKKRVIQGEVACGITDTDDAFEALKEGAAIGIVFLDQQGIGSLIIPNTVCMLHNAPHPTNAKRLIDYLLSRKTEKKLAESCAQMPLHKGVNISKDIPSLDHIKAMKVDYEITARTLETIQNDLKKWVEN